MQRNWKISCVIGLEELILLKYPYYPKQCTDLMQSIHDIFHRTKTSNSKILMGDFPL